jgi:hypothetical protein
MTPSEATNFDAAINNALKHSKCQPTYQSGMWGFNDWLDTNYQIQVELLSDPNSDCREQDRKWKVVLGDDNLATLFKLKYG